VPIDTGSHITLFCINTHDLCLLTDSCCALIYNKHVSKTQNSNISNSEIKPTFALQKSHGVGASRATVAHAALQVPSAALHAKTAAGAAAAATTVPKVKPAPA
jgi:hypothetical protein